MTSMTPDQFFNGGGGAPSFKFTKPGDSVRGTITDLKVVQQTTYVPGGVGEPKKWPSGDPMMQLNVTLQTSLRDPTIEDDDGKRRVYIDGRRIRETVTEAFRAVGAQGLEVGGEYEQTFTGYDPDSKNPANPAKVYKVTYSRPNPSAEFFGSLKQPEAAPAPSGGANEASLQAALANLSPEVKAALLAQASKTG